MVESCSLSLIFASATCIGLKQVTYQGKLVITREGRELPKLHFKGKAKFYKRHTPLGVIESVADLNCLRQKVHCLLEGI